MKVQIAINVPTEDGADFETVVIEEAVDANSQGEALSEALDACAAAGIDDGAIEGVRLKMADGLRLLDHERFVDGDLQAVVGLIAARTAAPGLR